MASIMSIALGSCLIEKHFTLDKNNKGPDHSSSLDPKEFSELIIDARKASKTLGSSVLKLTNSEKTNAKIMKRSIVISNDITKGKKITKNDIICKRPAGGLEPKNFEKLIGKRIKKNLKKNSYIFLKDVF
jgi:sialic acid synthase SpsE